MWNSPRSLISQKNLVSKNSRPLSLVITTLMLALLLANALLVGSVSTAQAEVGKGIAPGSESPFGLNIQGNRYPGNNLDWSLPFESAVATGAQWTREEFLWHRIEPTKGKYDWLFMDKIVDAGVQRGFNFIGLLDYNVDRGAPGDARISFSPPNLSDWAGYVRAVVGRYSNRIKHWQIWNEPQNPIYFSTASPTDYARLLATSYDAIKAVDGSAKVFTAGFVPVADQISWMEQMNNAGGAGKFDYIAIHPYVNDPTTGPAGNSMSPERARWLTTLLHRAENLSQKLGKPLWATEFGWTNVNHAGHQNAVSLETQANYLTRAYLQGLGSTIQKFFVYQFHDDNMTATDRYGLIGTDWRSKKPAFNAYANMTEQLNGATPKGMFDPYENGSKYDKIATFDGSGNVGCSSGQGSGASGAAWGCFASGGAQTFASISGEQARSGQSLKINYGFNNSTRDRYVTYVLDSFPATNFNPNRVGFWMLGDGTQTQMRILIRDSANKLLIYDNIGVSAAKNLGWRKYEALLPYPDFVADGGGTNISYPIKKMEILLDGWPKSSSYGGEIFIDDVFAEETPPVFVSRFSKGGKTLDVVWADNANANVSLPSAGGAARVVNRDGGERTVNTANGAITITASDAPQYVYYDAASVPPPDGGGGSGGGGNPVPGCSGAGDSGLRGAYNPTWERFDEPVVTGRTARSWIWGPSSFRYVKEPYDEAAGGCRSVLYWDKSRMEISNPGGNRNDKYYVTNGLLAKELIAGRIQVGNSRFITAAQGSAQIPVAGDADDPNGPTYKSFAAVTTLNNDKRAPKREGATVIETINRNGNATTNGGLGGYNVKLTSYFDATGHNTADVFWRFMNSRGPIKVDGQFIEGDAVDYLYSIGYPVSEPYWAKVKLAGKTQDVLIQVFERRVLTYTPSNSAAYQVEMGNIGRHYATWRYGKAEG